MKRKTLFALVTFIIIVCLVPLTACNNASGKFASIRIQLDGKDIVTGELDVFISDKLDLSVIADDGSIPAVKWNSSKPSVATVNAQGVVEAVGSGTAIISAVETVTGKNYGASVFVNAKHKAAQVGVGSGKTADDPIFMGNEGSDEPLEIYFIEMTQIYADSIFIKKGNVEVLFDAGYELDGKNVNAILREKVTDNRLDMLLVSHSDGDHIDGLANALEGVNNVSLMVDFGGVGNGNVKAAREKYTQRGMVYHSAYDCVNGLNGAVDRYYLTSELYVDILNTGNYILNTDSNASNPKSVATIFNYKDFKFFTAGDLTSEAEKDLIKNEVLPRVTLYKAAHHGSHGSNSRELLDILDPLAVAISAARASQYGNEWKGPKQNETYNLNAASGHPAAAAIERIYQSPRVSDNLNVYWNAVNGTMKFSTYGEDNYTFQGSATVKGYYDLSLTNGQAVWNADKQDFENRVTGEENFKLHETKAFIFRDYVKYLPDEKREQLFPDYRPAEK